MLQTQTEPSTSAYQLLSRCWCRGLHQAARLTWFGWGIVGTAWDSGSKSSLSSKDQPQMCERLSASLSQSKVEEVGLNHQHSKVLIWLGGGCWWHFLLQTCVMTNVRDCISLCLTQGVWRPKLRTLIVSGSLNTQRRHPLCLLAKDCFGWAEQHRSPLH